MILLHNPRCSKSRAALAALEERGLTLVIRRYLDEPLNSSEIGELLAQLGIAPLELIRQKEELWCELSAGKAFSDDELIALLAAQPKLIERPILIHQGRAAIGRPLANLFAIL